MMIIINHTATLFYKMAMKFHLVKLIKLILKSNFPLLNLFFLFFMCDRNYIVFTNKKMIYT